MTTENVELQTMLGKLFTAGDGDFLRGVLVRALRQVMEAEVFAVCNAAYGERTDDRLASWNGYRPRTLDTRVGRVGLQVGVHQSFLGHLISTVRSPPDAQVRPRPLLGQAQA